MARQKVTFAPNIPTQVVLDSEPTMQQNASGAEEWRYFLAGEQIMWVPLEAHQQIQDAGAVEGDSVVIEKRKRGKEAANWIVTTEPEPDARQALRNATTAPASRQPAPPRPTRGDNALPARGLAADPIPQPPTPDARQAVEESLTAADLLAGALAAAIDAATEASDYARRKGLALAWTAADIRAMAATLYIERAKHHGGRQC